MAYNLLISGIFWGYNPLTNLLLRSCDIQVGEFSFGIPGELEWRYPEQQPLKGLVGSYYRNLPPNLAWQFEEKIHQIKLMQTKIHPENYIGGGF